MPFLVFALTYPFIWVFSRLPMRILYIKSDIFFFLIYYVFQYRKKVVLENLSLAFPEKSERERKEISRKFFKHFIDLIMESIKYFSISEKEIKARYKYLNPEIVDFYGKKGQNIIIVGAHQGNWEWSTSMPLALETTVLGAYTRIANKYYEKAIKKSRMRFGIDGYKTSQTVANIKKNIANHKHAAYILLSDQSPQLTKTFYWSTFFGVKVPIHTGAEMLAKKFDCVMINYVAKKVKRGYYEIEFELITETPKAFHDYELTEKYLTITEKNINQQPEIYLWSHKRFKHRNKFEEWKEMKISKPKTKN
ncbi:lysophospholipid acyltransferase family protein [Polaribacter litorisediminis]|uniref:lysophospholipid acyltransferase family protein n=1 Tax=Polaribacter litorisediminis TaxID=1908341 RepID=UPI001CBBA79F|nr:lysophospholipid acyltransferase family protein [Polaribacter litorisediminis]UAM99949.1 lysophospholipid acyltransferase family protein [Polaribacter litorisediminis]